MRTKVSTNGRVALPRRVLIGRFSVMVFVELSLNLHPLKNQTQRVRHPAGSAPTTIRLTFPIEKS